VGLDGAGDTALATGLGFQGQQSGRLGWLALPVCFGNAERFSRHIEQKKWFLPPKKKKNLKTALKQEQKAKISGWVSSSPVFLLHSPP
jgi:hypothetical protein